MFRFVIYGTVIIQYYIQSDVQTNNIARSVFDWKDGIFIKLCHVQLVSQYRLGQGRKMNIAARTKTITFHAQAVSQFFFCNGLL